MTQQTPRIGLIHAVQVAMSPVQQAFQERWPEATLMSVLDDSLPADLQRAGSITPPFFDRFPTPCLPPSALKLPPRAFRVDNLTKVTL